MFGISRRKLIRIGVLSSTIGLLSQRSHADSASTPDDALTILASDERFTFWVRALKSAGMAQYAAGSDQFTAFIPTNDAFSKYPNILAAVVDPSDGRQDPDPTSISAFVKAHIIPGRHPLSDFSGNIATLISMAGTPITIDGTSPTEYSITWVSADWRSATTRLPNAPIFANNALLYPFDNVTLV